MAEKNSSKANPTVLLVDDEPEVLASYGRLIQRFLPEVSLLKAGSAHEALKILRGTNVDVIVADYRMPEMDGIQFLGEARLLNPRIRRVIFTAYAEPELAKRAAAEAMVDDFVSKDTDPALVVERIRRLL